MSRIDKIWSDLAGLKTEAQVIAYWENRQSRILDAIMPSREDYDKSLGVIYLIAKSLNNKEHYSAVFHLYKAGYLQIENHFLEVRQLNEVKYELGRGLHHNRKYSDSKKLFNELAASGFDTSRIDNWWNQSVYASTRDKHWFKTDLLPGMGRFIILISFIVLP